VQVQAIYATKASVLADGSKRREAKRMRKDRGQKRAKGYQVTSVTYQTEVVRIYHRSDGSTSQERQVARYGRNPTEEGFEGAFGLYFIDRGIITLACPGGELLIVSSGNAVKNVGRTFFHWDCVIMTVRRHAIARPNDLPRLMQLLLEDEGQRLVAFEVDGRYCYYPCEKRDRVLERPQPKGKKEEPAPGNPKVNSPKVVSKTKN
jgi:hypothetical protein